jgi:hypothetical protein
MLKINDSSEKFEIGKSSDSTHICYASMDKYKKNEYIKLKNIKCKYLNLS